MKTVIFIVDVILGQNKYNAGDVVEIDDTLADLFIEQNFAKIKESNYLRKPKKQNENLSD